MKMIPLGSTDIKLSRMVLGTWAIGGGPAWNGDLDLQVCIDTIVEAHRCGINLIDTAPGYNFGNSEVIVGQALKKLPRNDIVVETKCGIVWERTGSLFNKVGDRQLYKNLTPESIREEVEASLQRLGIDTIDIYMTHWQSVEPCFTPIAETVDTLNALKKRGKFVLSVRRTSMPGISGSISNTVSWISSRPSTASLTGRWKVNCCRYAGRMASLCRSIHRLSRGC